MQVTLDGKIYELRSDSGVKRTPLEEWSDNIRLDGQQQRKDRRLMSAWVIDSWAEGLGRKEINVATAADLSSLWDADNVDTRIDGQIVLSPAFNACEITPSRGDLNLAFDYLGNIYFAETTRGTISIAYQFAPPNAVGSYRRLAFSDNTGVNNEGSIIGIYPDGGAIDIIARNIPTTNTVRINVPTLGGTYSSVTNLGANISVTRLAQLAKLGNDIYAVTHQETHTNLWLAWSAVATLYHVVGTALAPLANDGLTMYAQLPEGVYDFDATPSIAVSTDRAKDKNCMQVMFQNYLLFKNKKSLVLYDGTNTNSIGYDERDGLVTEKMGEVTAMCSSWKYCFAAVKGGTYSHILALNEKYKWSYYAKIPSPGLWVREMFLSDSPDAIDRLWVIFGNYSIPGYFLNPMVNPLQSGTYAYVPTGEFTPPKYDGGLSEIPAGFYDISVSGDSITANNKITCFYGLNSNDAVTTLGIIASTSQTLVFGSPVGLEAFKIQPKFMLTTGSTAQTPVYRKSIINFLKEPDKREFFDFDVDIEKTANQWVRPNEDVLGSLSYLSNLRPLFPFHYGQIGTKQVKMLTNPVSETADEAKTYEKERNGIVSVRVSEII